MNRDDRPAFELGECAVTKMDMNDSESSERRSATPTRPQGALALVGAWRVVNEKELESLIEEIYAGRRKDVGRRVELEL